MDFRQILESIMQERGITAYQIWKETKIPQSTIGKWRAGKGVPSSENAVKLAKFLNVSVDYLLGIEPNEKPTENLDGLKRHLLEITSDLTPDEEKKLLDYYDLLKAARRKKSDQ